MAHGEKCIHCGNAEFAHRHPEHRAYVKRDKPVCEDYESEVWSPKTSGDAALVVVERVLEIKERIVVVSV